MAPSWFLITAATPALPLAPTPLGQRTALPEPRVQAEENAFIELVNALVVPDPSERCTQLIGPGAQPSSFQFLITDIATFTACSWVSFRSQPGLLYPKAMVPPTIGICTTPRFTLRMSRRMIGSSDAPKFTV